MVADTYKLVVKGRYSVGGSPETRNIYYFSQGTPVDNTALTAFANEFIAAVYDLLQSFMTVHYSIYGWDMFILSSGSWYPVVSGSSAIVGDDNEFSQMPSSVTANVNMSTDRLRSRGRKFFGGFSNVSDEDGAPTAALLDALVDVAALLITNYVSEDAAVWVPKIWSVAHGILDIVGGSVKQQFGTLRKRESGVGS